MGTSCTWRGSVSGICSSRSDMATACGARTVKYTWPSSVLVPWGISQESNTPAASISRPYTLSIKARRLAAGIITEGPRYISRYAAHAIDRVQGYGSRGGGLKEAAKIERPVSAGLAWEREPAWYTGQGIKRGGPGSVRLPRGRLGQVRRGGANTGSDLDRLAESARGIRVNDKVQATIG